MQAIKADHPDENIDFCTSVSSLALKLSEHRNDEKMAILVPADEEQLIDIYSIKNLLNKVSTIIVLPNRDVFVEAMGYGLRPRIVCYRDAGVIEAAQLKNYNNENRRVEIILLAVEI